MTSHGHAADSTGAPEINNRGGSIGRTGFIFPQPPRDPYHRPRARALVTDFSWEADAMAPQLTAVSRGSRPWRCR